MPTYEVTITRTAFATHTFRVQADTCEEAEELALDEAGDVELTEHDAAYDVDRVVLVDDDERIETP